MCDRNKKTIHMYIYYIHSLYVMIKFKLGIIINYTIRILKYFLLKIKLTVLHGTTLVKTRKVLSRQF